MAGTSLFRRWSDYQLSRLELVIAIIMILVLLSMFLNRMVVMLAQAERVLVENTMVNLNSALRFYAARLRMTANAEALSNVQHRNPVKLLEEKPESPESIEAGSEQLTAMLSVRSSTALPNYAGEMTEAEAVNLKGGSWYFDPEQRSLIYRVRNAEVFRSDLPGPARIRYRMVLDFQDLNNDGRYSGEDKFNNLSLEPLDDYQWLF
jgi:hypothetical protein